MWKDFFYYSRSERRAIIALVVTGILLLLGSGYYKSLPEKRIIQVDSICLDSFCIRTYQRQQAYEASYRKFPKRKYKPAAAYPRRKSSFYRADSVRGRGDSAFHRTDSSRSFYPKQIVPPRVEKFPEGTCIDLNQADTLMLQRVPGIGPYFAKQIVAYRNRLGGYAEVSQLQEIPNLNDSVNRWFRIESGVYRKLRVNRMRLDPLRNHPYMNFYRARAILEYRRKRGKIKGLSQLSLFEEFTEKDLQRLKPYLDFE